MTAKVVVESLIEHWRAFGLLSYAQFDNDTIFQGTHAHPDLVGWVSRLCLSLGVAPVFVVPHEFGFQSTIENSNPKFRTSFSHNLPCDEDLTAILTPNCSQNISGSFLTHPGCHRDIVPHGTQTPSCLCRQSHQHHQGGDLYQLLPPTHLLTGREGPA